jgi:hypothetical protein
MTKVQALRSRPQQVPIVRTSYAGTWQPTSPLEAMTMTQFAIEGAQERIEETQVLRPLTEEAAHGVVAWAARDSLDWAKLADSIDGWGTAEP